jgi:ribosome-binding protein aMBF1 (putative translation factor)
MNCCGFKASLGDMAISMQAEHMVRPVSEQNNQPTNQPTNQPKPPQHNRKQSVCQAYKTKIKQAREGNIETSAD